MKKILTKSQVKQIALNLYEDYEKLLKCNTVYVSNRKRDIALDPYKYDTDYPFVLVADGQFVDALTSDYVKVIIQM